MKKLKTLLIVALLALGANVSAQEEGEKDTEEAAATTTAASATIGGIATSTVVIGAVAVGVAAAIISNNRSRRGAPPPPPPPPGCRVDQIEVDGVCVCPGGTIEINGVCTIDPGVEVFVCNDGDTLTDGNICEGVTLTQTLSGTTTITVPVTFTYLPNVITVPTPQ